MGRDVVAQVAGGDTLEHALVGGANVGDGVEESGAADLSPSQMADALVDLFRWGQQADGDRPGQRVGASDYQVFDTLTAANIAQKARYPAGTYACRRSNTGVAAGMNVEG